MINKLRRRIILINLVLIGVLLAVIFIAVNINSYSNSVSMMERGMTMVLEQDGRNAEPPWKDNGMPSETPATEDNAFRREDKKKLHHTFGEETPIQISSYVIVNVKSDGVMEAVTEKDLSIEDETLQNCVSHALDSRDSFGQINAYGVMFVKHFEMDSTKIVFASNSSIYTSLFNSILISVLLFIGGLAIIFLISLFLSGLAVKPVQKAWEQQKQFVADASHELKTPLTVILANNNIMLSHQTSTVAQEKQWLESTEEEANHMKKLIDNMLFLAKSDAGSASIQLSDVNFSEIVEGCALNFEPVAFEKEVLIHTDIAPNCILRGDNTQLKQLTHILVDNAVKYAAEKSTVTIRLCRHNEKTEFSVNNRGNVIAKEDIVHIFDRFYRAEKSRTTKGYGLGLSIAQRIAESMNGKISVESNETDGTTFTVVFSGKN